MWLRDTQLARLENVLLVLAIALVADFFMVRHWTAMTIIRI